MKLFALIAGLVAATALQAAPVYDNTTTDTFRTVVYSANAFTEIGDRIQLAGTERLGTSATVQFYNASDFSGSFDATLNLYGLPANNVDVVGSLLGSFTATGLAVTGFNSLDVSWALAGLSLPDDLIFTVSVANASSDLDLGLNLFDPPTLGSSSNQSFVARGGSGYTEATTGDGIDNAYFRLDARGANSVPEPGTAGMLSLAMLSLIAIRVRRRSLPR